MAVLDYLHEHREILTWLGFFSVVSFVGSLVLIPVLCVRMSEDYFTPRQDAHKALAGQHPVIRVVWLVVSHLIGILLIAAGTLMLVLPGQGVLTILIGVMLLQFPGKRALELRLIRIPAILKTVNALRARAGHPPLRLPAVGD